MGWSTELFTNISFNRETFACLSDVEYKLEDVNRMIDSYKEELRSLALITEPKKFCDEEQDPLWYIQNKFNNSIEELEDLYIERYKLNLVIQTWNESHDEEGYAIKLPDNIKWDTSFIYGDFIKTKEDKE